MAQAAGRQPLPALLREETAELLALLPAARHAAAGGPGGGEAALDGMARAAYRLLRIAENLEACAALARGPALRPFCATALAAAYVSGAAGVCRQAVFRPHWPQRPLWTMGDERLFADALGSLLANAVQYGGERPTVTVRALGQGGRLLLAVADSGTGCPDGGRPAEGLGLRTARLYAEACGGSLLTGCGAGRGLCVSLCLPLCAPGGRQRPPDYVADRFSPLYVQLAPVCDLPL